MNDAERQWLEAHGFELDIEYCAKHDDLRWYTIPDVKVPYEIPPTRPLEEQPFFVTVTEYQDASSKCHDRILILTFHMVTPAHVTIDPTGLTFTESPREEKVFSLAMATLDNEEWHYAVFRWNRKADELYGNGYYRMKEPT